MAAPIVATVASMVWAVNDEFTGEEVQEIVLNNTKYIAGDNPSLYYTGGSFLMVNAELAVKEAVNRGGTVNGRFSDAEDGSGVMATYKTHKDSEDSEIINGGGNGESSDSDDTFSSKLKAGKYVYGVSAYGYVPTFTTVEVPIRGTIDIEVSLTRVLNPGAYRIILNWEIEPDDLDSHTVYLPFVFCVTANENAVIIEKDEGPMQKKQSENNTIIPAMFCPHCGHELPKDARFCIKCGKDIQQFQG